MTTETSILLMEAGFSAVWLAARLTLSAVTMTAIANRVLFLATEQYPPFALVRVAEGSGIDAALLRARSQDMDPDQLALGARFVVIQLLTVLGNLTADILTPDLHTALKNTVLPAKAEGEDTNR